VQHRFGTVELGKGNREKMCLQPAAEVAVTLDGWMPVKNIWHQQSPKGNFFLGLT